MAVAPIVAAERAFRAGNVKHAERALRAILARSPAHSRANELMAYISANRGDLDRAQALLAIATSSRDASPEAWYYLGSLLVKKARYGEATSALEQALRLAGDFFEGLHDLAVAMVKQGRAEEALPLFQRAEALGGTGFELLNNKGNALSACGRYQEAVETYERASAINPRHPATWLNRAMALQNLGRRDEALSCYSKAAALEPPDVGTLCTFADTAHQLNRHDDALEYYRRALALNANDADSRYGMAITLLQRGDFEEGFSQYEARWDKTEGVARRRTRIPVWGGDAAISDKRVLLWAEQGYGDTLQFCRYARLVASLGARVTLEVQPSLKRLVGSLEGIRVVARGEADEHYDLHSPLLSLPRLMRTTLQTVPAATPYLRSDPELAARWGERMGEKRGQLRIAIACSGRPRHVDDRKRSMPLAHFAPLQDVAQLFLLQPDLAPEDREFLRSAGAIRFLGEEIEDFADTAAVLAQVDLVISIDTSLAHLAGALARPVWIMLPWAADWRWLTQRSDSPWYPTARLFRQHEPGDWAGVMADVQRAAREWSAARQ